MRIILDYTDQEILGTLMEYELCRRIVEIKAIRDAKLIENLIREGFTLKDLQDILKHPADDYDSGESIPELDS